MINRQAKRISINLYIQTGMKLLKAYSQLVLVVFVGGKKGDFSFFLFFFSDFISPEKSLKLKQREAKSGFQNSLGATPWGFVIDRDRSTSC